VALYPQNQEFVYHVYYFFIYCVFLQEGSSSIAAFKGTVTKKLDC